MTSTNISSTQIPIKNPTQIIGTKTSSEDRQFTFKIIKRRSPWNKNEDQAIIELVAKHGTGNWTIIANEMASNYNFKNRSGKQCRERWHNHLDPNVNKDYWSEKEENILFNKHMEFGNKWSDIAKYLPGRTDNAIKNHFYSKLRKYIRKILKQINKENLMKMNGIDSNKYNSDKIYKMLKKFKIDYKSLNKETVLNLIISNEKNAKGNKNDIQLLKNKTRRSKSLNHFIKSNNSYMNLSNQNANTNNTNSISNSGNSVKKLSLNTNFTTVHFRSKSKAKASNESFSINTSSHANKHHTTQMYQNFISKTTRKRKRTKRRKVSICLSTPENKKTQISKILPSRKFGFGNAKVKRTRKSNHLDPSDLYPSNNDTEYIRPGLEIKNKTNIIIDKYILNKPSSSPSPKRVPPSININIINATTNNFQNINNISQPIPTNRRPVLPELNLSFTEPMSTNHGQTPHYINFPNDDKTLFGYFDNQPQLSPMNLNNVILYPQSTRNLFNIDLPVYDGGLFKNSNGTYIIPTPKQTTMPNFMPTPNNTRDYFMQNKILINEMKSKINYSYDHMNIENTYANENNSNNNNTFTNIFSSDKGQTQTQPIKKRPQIDLSLVNQSETNTLFMESLGGTSKNNNTNTTNMFNLSPVSAFTPSKPNDR